MCSEYVGVLFSGHVDVMLYSGSVGVLADVVLALCAVAVLVCTRAMYRSSVGAVYSWRVGVMYIGSVGCTVRCSYNGCG